MTIGPLHTIAKSYYTFALNGEGAFLKNHRISAITPGLILLAAILGGCQSSRGPFNIRNFGAKGDGKALDTPAINDAISAASSMGGGTVQVPSGTYLCYSVHLKSNVTIHLDQGAVILAAGTPDDGQYDPPEPNSPNDKYEDFGHSHWHNSLIWGEDVHDVTIEGPGMIYGKGLSRGSATRPTTGPFSGFGGFGTTQPFDGRGFGFGRRGFGGSRPSTRPFGRRGGGFGGGFAGSRPTTVEGNPDNQDDRADATTLPGGSPADLSYPNPRDTLKAGVGNKSISLKNSHNIIFRDFSILHGGHFGILVTGVDNLTIDNLKIDTERDGMDIDCCKNVRITNSTVNSPWDDAIVLKSCFALGTTRPCENITIDDCAVSGGYEEGTVIDGTFKRIGRWYTGSFLGTSPPPSTRAAPTTTFGAGFGGFNGATSRPPGGPGRTGRIKLGTESNGGFLNIAISNCVFDDCQGLAIESVDGAIIEDVSITNLTMRNIVSVPIFIRLGDRARGPDHPETGVIRRVNISNVVCDSLASRYACIISGIPGHPIEDLSISNVRIKYPGGGTADDALQEPEERENAYPEPTMFRGMPAWGFFIRHVTGLDINNTILTSTSPDERPPFQLDDVKNVDFHDIIALPDEDVPNFVLKNVEDFRAYNVKGMPNTSREKAQDEHF